MSAILSTIKTYTSICNQIEVNRKQCKELFEKKKELERDIKTYLRSSNSAGLTFEGQDFTLETKNKKIRLGKGNREKELIRILNSRGIRDVDVLIKEIANIGESKEDEVLKLKPHK